jgi:hypothetical protein
MLLALASPLRASLWVSASGDDGNPGTKERPLATLGRARDLVRTMNRDMSDDITVFLSGSFHLDQPVEFGPQDSATNGFSIIYTAAPGEHPVVSGAYRVTGWTLADRARNLWSAPAPEGLRDTHDLWVNGAPAQRTRVRLPQAAPKNPSPAPPADPRSQWKNPRDILLVAPEPDAIWSEREGAAPFYAENVFEFLGRPGEWYFDRAARRIYCVPRGGEDLAAADVEAAAAEAFLVGNGLRDRPLSGLVFKGIRFEYTTWIGPSPPGAAVRFRLAGALQFLEDRFVHLGTPALELGPGFAAGVVEGCLFGDIPWTAMRVAGASDVRISDSRFSYVATEHPGCCAVELRQSEGVSVDRTQIDHFPNAAILSDGAPLAGGRGAANLVSPPMIGLGGASPWGDPRTPASADAGVSAPYRALLEEPVLPRAAPRPPTAVSAEPEDGFAYVTWDPPCLDGSAPVTSYTVASSSGARMTVSAADLQAKGYVVFANLENGSGVTFTVAAANEPGPGPPSLASAPVVPARRRRLKVAQPPTAVAITVGAGASTVQLTPPSVTGGSPVVAYSLTALPSGKRIVLEGRDIIHSDGSHPLVRTIQGFVPDAGDTVAVAAVNAKGEGPPAVVKPQR